MYQLCHHHVKKSIYPFFSVKKNPKQNKRIFRENKFQEKRERELHLLKKWNDDICDIFPYDTFYRLETKVTKNKTKKKTNRKKNWF